MLYLTGFPEPAAVLVAWRPIDGHKAILFVRPKDRTREIWDGRRYGTRGCNVASASTKPARSRTSGPTSRKLLSNDGKVAHVRVDEGFDALFSVFRELSARRRKSRAPAHRC